MTAKVQSEPKAKGLVVVDDEIKLIAKIGRILATLQPQARARVISYLSSRYDEEGRVESETPLAIFDRNHV